MSEVFAKQDMGPDSHFFNREISWLRFNRRVLEESEDPRNPLLERARFLAIVGSNLDEFSMVRLARLYVKRDVEHEHIDPAGLDHQHTLDAVRRDVRALSDAQYRCWSKQVEPALAAEGITILRPDQWRSQDRDSLSVYYRDQLEPVLTPMAVDAGHPFPLVVNLGLHIAIELKAEGGGGLKRALIGVPGGRRLVPLFEAGTYALIEDVVAQNLASLFAGYRVCGSLAFRVTRDGGLEIDEDQAIDLLSEIEQELRNRAFGDPVRLEYRAEEDAVAEDLLSWLVEQLELEAENVIGVNGPLDLTMLFELAGRQSRADLEFEVFEPAPCPVDWADPFTAMRQASLLLHHPYQSFQPVVDLVARAAKDPQVRAIKMTLYRVSGDSPIVKSLIAAALSGKQVTVLVELKARFDEEANIRWARRLEESGAHVIYGITGLKVHCKLLMIVRADEDGLRRYCHLGTGNYNDKTARLYTDYSYLTANEAVGRDVAALFNMISGFARPPHWEMMAASPYSMRETFIQWIRNEADNARAGRPAQIRAKFNSLVDVAICQELYTASQAGVPIELVVRGICILRPGVPGLSETISVVSIIGRFLEHSRCFYFENHGDEPIVAIASADWMERNLDRRVEHLVRIEEPELREEIIAMLDTCRSDNRQARVLDGDGGYARRHPAGEEEERSTQQLMIAWARAQLRADKRSTSAAIRRATLNPQRRRR